MENLYLFFIAILVSYFIIGFFHWKKRALKSESAFKELLETYKERNGIKETTCEEEVN